MSDSTENPASGEETVDLESTMVMGDESSYDLNSDEHREIMKQIEETVAKQRMGSVADDFEIKAKKRWTKIPVAINAGSLILLVSFIFGFNASFNTNKEKIAQAEAAASAVDNQLIQELKKQSDEELLKREEEISAVKEQLRKIEEEKALLSSQLESSLTEKKAELDVLLEAELNKERNRLESEGFSPEEVQKMLDNKESELRTEYDSQYDEFQQQMQQEYENQELALANQAQEYESNLSGMREEMENLQAELQQKELELRKQMEAQQNEAAAERSARTAAEDQIKALQESKEREESLTNQLNGYYYKLDQYLASENWDAAMETLSLLERFIDSSLFESSQTLAAEKSQHEFIIKTIQAYVDYKFESAKALDELLSQSEELREEEIGSLTTDFQKQIAQLRMNLEDTTESRNNLQQELNSTIEDYEEKLEQEREIQASLENDIADLLELHQKALSDLRESHQEEIAQIDEANTKAVDELSAAHEVEIADLKAEQERQFTDLLTSQRDKITELYGENQVEVFEMSQRIDEKQVELDELKAEYNAFIKNIASAGGINSTSNGAISARVRELKSRSDTYDQFVSNYKSYQSKEDALLLKLGGYKSEAFAISGKRYLNQFLSVEESRALMPDLLNRIQRYDQAFQAAGAEDIAYELADIMYLAKTYGSNEDRMAYIQDEIDYGDPSDSKKEFLERLLALMKSIAE